MWVPSDTPGESEGADTAFLQLNSPRKKDRRYEFLVECAEGKLNGLRFIQTHRVGRLCTGDEIHGRRKEQK